MNQIITIQRMVIKLSKPIKFLFIGRTASGKSSIAKAVCERMGLKRLISYSTKPQGKKSNEDYDHIYMRDEDVCRYIDDMAAHTEVDGFKYFSTFEQLEDSDVYVIDPNGLDDLKIKCGDKYDLVEIYIRTPQKIAEQRAKLRGDNLKSFKQRWVAENQQFTNYENRHTFAWHLRNDRPFDESVNKVCKWIQIELDKRKEDTNAKT